MFIDLLVIIIIIVISYALCMHNKHFSCQVSHMVIGFTVLIMYHVLNSSKVKAFLYSFKNKVLGKENFEQLPDTINSFLQGENINRPSAQNITSMNPATSQQYLSKLDSLINAVDSINKDNQTTTNNLSSNNISTVDRLNLESLQQFQNFQIQYIQNQINKTKDLINSQQMTENTKKYKPIKVYSSCVVANANGNTTTNSPLSSSIQQQSSTSGVPQQILNTMSQSNTPNSGPALLQQQQQAGQNTLNLATTTGSIGNLLNRALNANGLNINLTS